MHELALMQSLVETIEARARDVHVLTVRLEVGRLTAVTPDALRFCFEVCTHGGVLEGAVLEVIEVDPVARCNACGAEGVQEGPVLVCGCGSFDLQVLAGDELRLKELEVL